MRARYIVTAFAGKSTPWGRALRRLILGANAQVLPWVEKVRGVLNLSPSYYDILRVIATHMGAEAWDDMRLCIGWIVERVSWSRSTVERALRYFRMCFILRQDGEIPVKQGRPVVRYRLGSTPDCPLPWEVVEARETAGQGGNDVYNSSTGPSVLVKDQGDIPDTPVISPTAGVSNYRPAPPVKTGPHVDRSLRGGLPRRPSHLRRLRALAKSVVTARDTAVTYCHPPTRGEAVTPFTDPALGALPRDTRLFYLGLLDLHNKFGDRTPNDALFLKAELFRYDEDIDQRTIRTMLETLSNAGKIHLVSGDVVLSDPPKTTDMLELPIVPAPKRTVRATVRRVTTEDPWFAAFWDAYPRRTGKGAARKAFATAVAAGADPQVIVATASAYADRCDQLQKEPQFIPHPATWLNQERWEDDEEQAPRVRSKVDDAMRSGMDLVQFYQQQEAIQFDDKPNLEIEW